MATAMKNEKKPSNKKPAKKGSVAKAPLIELESDDDESEDEDDDDEEPAKARRPKKSHKERLVLRATRAHKSMLRVMAMLEGSGNDDALDAVTATRDSLEKAIEELRSLDADWRPTRSARSSASFDKGDMVEIGAAYRDLYAELLEPDELDDLRVLTQQKKVVAVVTGSGSKIFVPAQHLKAA